MKLIGLEFRVGMDAFRELEVCVVPLDLVFPFPFSYPHGPRANVTLHTSRGDLTSNFGFGTILSGFNGTYSADDMKKHFDELQAQVERIHV